MFHYIINIKRNIIIYALGSKTVSSHHEIWIFPSKEIKTAI